MKRYINSTNFFKNHVAPQRDNAVLWNNFNTKSQADFNTYIESIPGIQIEGNITEEEQKVIRNIKEEIEQLKVLYSDVTPDRLDLDLAIIFHRNLKRLNWGRYQIEDISTWRWLSVNFFLKETFWRWAENDFRKSKFFESAKSCYDRLIGERSRRIFPLRYFIIAERLYDPDFGYSLIEKLAETSRTTKTGGFGNLYNNLTETKLISPNEHVAKTMSKLLLGGGRIGSNDEVKDAFVRYNAFKKRLLNFASDTVFEKEICVINSTL